MPCTTGDRASPVCRRRVLPHDSRVPSRDSTSGRCPPAQTLNGSVFKVLGAVVVELLARPASLLPGNAPRASLQKKLKRPCPSRAVAADILMPSPVQGSPMVVGQCSRPGWYCVSKEYCVRSASKPPDARIAGPCAPMSDPACPTTSSVTDSDWRSSTCRREP